MDKGKNLKDSIEPVNIESTKTILSQMKHCICKIIIKERFKTGFFCIIPFRKETIKVLMTNYQFLNEKDFKDNKKLNLSLYDEKEKLTIDLGIERETYFNKDYDITLIELKEEDNIKYYLKLDVNLFKDNSEINYKNQSIYVLHYPKGMKASVSYGILNNIDKFYISHNCRIDIGSSGSPILNLKNNKVIGIQNKGSINYNIGTLLKFPLKDFISKIEKKYININGKEFKIIKELGKGGFARVIQVLSKTDNKYYAIKVIPIKNESKEKIESSQNEAIILSKFNCENIVKYYDISKDENNIYILMEYCNGENLRSFIDNNMNNNTLIEEDIIYNIISQICKGIQEIHNKKIIHRDLNPKNIFMNKNMIIKIGDFGISKLFDSHKKYMQTKNRAGTEYYISPEIDDGIYNEKSDIWSLGCIIYELFNLSFYYKDAIRREIKKIDSSFYNNKWQELIDSLLKIDYNKRFNINQVNKFLKEELVKINLIDSIELIKNKINNNKINKIIGEIYINKDDINKDIPIINSFEKVKREWGLKDEDDDLKYENEKEIKENIEIKINGQLIKFTYYLKFYKEGKYNIEYSFKNNLTKTCYMFFFCLSLTYLNLSNFNTQNVTNMSLMFSNCKSLTNLNLSNFNTQKVTNMSGMFYDCNSLKNLNLSNFNTQKVIDLSYMFSSCYSLKYLNISKFNTQNVTDMSYIFYHCYSLKNLNTSNFNTQKVADMSYMFSVCNLLTNLNLSNFNTQNVSNLRYMFFGCDSLKINNLITKDYKILNELKNK